jgi:hypothetical protein
MTLIDSTAEHTSEGTETELFFRSGFDLTKKSRQVLVVRIILFRWI